MQQLRSVFRCFLCLQILFFVCSCSNSESDYAADSRDEEEVEHQGSSVLKDYVRTPLNSAEGVSDTAEERNDQLKEALDEVDASG